MKNVVICGYMIRFPVAGNMLAYFHSILGFCRLGIKVIYLEESGWDSSCYNLVKQNYNNDPSFGLESVQQLAKKYNVEFQVCYVNRDTKEIYGTDWEELKELLRTADLLINLGGVCWLTEFLLCPCRILIDMDPFFTQIGKFAQEGFENYHYYFTFGTNVGKSNCSIPTNDIDWLPIVPVVVPEIWQNASNPSPKLTTIANWSAYGGVTYNNEYYGQKREEFLRFIDLPQHCSQPIELALSGIDNEIKIRLEKAGWLLESGIKISADLTTYQNYIINSQGEFSVAKNAYVKTRSGWISDRSVCYLAAGRPILVQDTGISDWLPTTQEGILTFSNFPEVLDGIESINANYEKHKKAAIELVEEFFNATKVISSMLEIVMN
jgi:hypothetical protein